MALSPEDRLGPYEIVAPLGAGSMGEVYRTTDAKLKRDVQLLAQVHPTNIASIFGLEELGGACARAIIASR